MNVQDEIESVMYQMDQWLHAKDHRQEADAVVERWRNRLKQIAIASQDPTVNAAGRGSTKYKFD